MRGRLIDEPAQRAEPPRARAAAAAPAAAATTPADDDAAVFDDLGGPLDLDDLDDLDAFADELGEASGEMTQDALQKLLVAKAKAVMSAHGVQDVEPTLYEGPSRGPQTEVALALHTRCSLTCSAVLA